MARCAGTTRDNRQCTAIVKPPNTYCYQHDPARSEERKRNASRAGKSTGSREIKDLKGQLATLADDVLEGRVDRGDAAVVNQIINTRARLVETERKIREADELEERLRALEQDAEQQKGGKRWGA